MPDLGTKYECTGCGTKFYDMGRADAVCPKCGLDPLTDEIEEIVEEEPAAEQDAARTEPERPRPTRTTTRWTRRRRSA